MIANAIQSILQPTINSFYPIVESDILPTGLFCVHNEEIIETYRDKEGIYGFDFNLVITVVSEDLDDIDTACASIHALLTSAEGVYQSTAIEEIRAQSSNGAIWDDNSKKYHDQLTFIIHTKNL